MNELTELTDWLRFRRTRVVASRPSASSPSSSSKTPSRRLSATSASSTSTLFRLLFPAKGATAPSFPARTAGCGSGLRRRSRRGRGTTTRCCTLVRRASLPIRRGDTSRLREIELTDLPPARLLVRLYGRQAPHRPRRQLRLAAQDRQADDGELVLWRLFVRLGRRQDRLRRLNFSPQKELSRPRISQETL